MAVQIWQLYNLYVQTRDKIHPQLEELWAIHPSTQTLKLRRYIPKSSYMLWETHHTLDDSQPLQVPPPDGSQIDLCEPIAKAGAEFLPLVRQRTALKCALKITFLRKEKPGRVYVRLIFARYGCNNIKKEISIIVSKLF